MAIQNPTQINGLPEEFTTLPDDAIEIQKAAGGTGSSRKLPLADLQNSRQVTAGEDLDVDSVVNLHWSGSDTLARHANADSGVRHRAHGFTRKAFSLGAQATIYFTGILASTGFDAGDMIYLDPLIPGEVTNSAPSDPEDLRQIIGTAINDLEVSFTPKEPQADSDSDGEQITVIAGVSIGAHRAVSIHTDGTAILADNTVDSTGQGIIGVSTHDATAGNQISIRGSGKLITTQTFTVGLPVYVGVGGALTQTPPLSGYHTTIGKPTSGKVLMVDVGETIYF